MTGTSLALAAEPAAPAAAALQALRQRGAPALDPVGWCHIEALARRTASHQGQTRRLLDDRLTRLLAACSARMDHAGQAARAVQPGSAATSEPPRATAPAPGPLATLLAHIARHAPAPVAGAGRVAEAGPGPLSPGTRDLPELKAVHHYRSTWARLKMDQRLTQVLAQVPAQAGPLHTQRLLHEALTLMRDTAPLYLQRLMAQVEVCLWLEQAAAGAAAAGTNGTNSTDGTDGAAGRAGAAAPKAVARPRAGRARPGAGPQA